MRSIFAAIFAGLLAISTMATVADARARNASESRGAVAAIKRLAAQNPDGGPALQAAIYQILASNPALADEVVDASIGLSPAQQAALGAAVGEASVLFQADPQATALISTAVNRGTLALQNGYSEGRELALAALNNGGFNVAGGNNSPFVLVPTSSGGTGAGLTSPQ